ncbi:MAG: hypothetical protein JJ992_30500, partial [Planctomycetes bacterium]|nr:hypothetical protein [Planctomycetota bacterium]
MTRKRMVSWLSVFSLAGLLFATRIAAAVDTEDLRYKQQTQEKARALARELVSGVLEIQIRQLKENGLDKLPIFDEIESMSKNIDALVDAEMQEVVQLLVQAQEGSREERLAHFEQARSKIRDVVVRLMAERQKLLRRLQVAKLAAQVRQLIGLEVKTLDVTSTLAQLAEDDRESIALSNIQDQRDVKSLFLVLVESLADVSQWGGQVGAGAADGLRILKAAETGVELDKAGQSLQDSRYEEAADSQRIVLRGLRALLERIEQTQGLISSDREAALELIRDLLDKQQKLREEVRKNERPDDQQVEQLVQQQAEIHKALSNLDQPLDEIPAAQPLLEQAKASAYEAAAQLFEENREQAMAEQGRVIGSLAELEQMLQQAMDQDDTDRTAEELAGQVEQLQQLKKDLEQIAEQQDDVNQRAADAAAEAQKLERSVAEALDKAAEAATDDAEDLPGVIESRLADAEEAVDKAVEAMQDTAPEAAADRQEAAASADQAIQ